MANDTDVLSHACQLHVLFGKMSLIFRSLSNWIFSLFWGFFLLNFDIFKIYSRY